MNENSQPLPSELHLVRDILDTALKDRAGQHLGRADRIVLSIRPGEPPHVIRLEAGAPALAARINCRLGRFVQVLGRRFGLHAGRPTRFPWSKLQSLGVDLILDLDKARSTASLWERWLQRHIIRRIPGIKKP